MFFVGITKKGYVYFSKCCIFVASHIYNPQNEMYQKLKRNVHFLSKD